MSAPTQKQVASHPPGQRRRSSSADHLHHPSLSGVKESCVSVCSSSSSFLWCNMSVTVSWLGCSDCEASARYLTVTRRVHKLEHLTKKARHTHYKHKTFYTQNNVQIPAVRTNVKLSFTPYFSQLATLLQWLNVPLMGPAPQFENCSIKQTNVSAASVSARFERDVCAGCGRPCTEGEGSVSGSHQLFTVSKHIPKQ